MSETPLTDLQLTLSTAVDQARAIEKNGVPFDYYNLCRTYGDQIFSALFARLNVHDGSPSEDAGEPTDV